MTFCVSDGSFFLGKHGTNSDHGPTHPGEIGHLFTVPAGGFPVFGSVVWGKNGEHVPCVRTQTEGFGVGCSVRKVVAIGVSPVGGQQTRQPISCSRATFGGPSFCAASIGGTCRDFVRTV